MDEPSAAKRPSVLTIDRAAFLLLRVKRAFKKKRQQRKDKHAAAAAAAAEALGTCRRVPPPLLRSRTLPAIVVPGLSILHAQIDAKNDLTQSQMLCRGVSTHKVCGLRAHTPRISFTSKDEDTHERRKSASSRLGSSPRSSIASDERSDGLVLRVPTPRGSVSSTSSSRLTRLLTQGMRHAPDELAADAPRRLSWERRATSANVAKSIENYVFLAHGVPETVVTDNGVQFTGSEFRKLMKAYNVPRIHYGPRYAPQVNTVERYNKTVLTMISSYVKDDHRTWDTNIFKIQFALNSAVNETTCFTPFFLVHGREPIINGSFYKDTSDIDYEIAMPREEYAGEFGTLQEIYTKVRENLEKAHATNARHYNLRRRDVKLREGQEVWKKTYVQSDADKFKASKLAPKYQKCIVKKVLSPLVYELVGYDGKPLGQWHIKDIKI